MYTTTFYSYKGGVGRTMALSNVAYLLASAGKRVLLVDFDLEAPGLSSYEPFRCAGARDGIVDYVNRYVETNASPNVADYIVKCDMGGIDVWLMPAGNHTAAGYSSAYSEIDWKDLYEQRSGFLLMEDMKQQWESYDDKGFDYVLIDSRTGHTDIGGICTRQLPDAVVVMFVPTPQNIDGLRPIVRAIGREKAPVRREKVALHFCPSNVPDLDDQEDILQDLLDDAKSKLSYDSEAAIIHHYSSLDILQQPIYAATHPRSKLVKQYETLRKTIEAGNLRDRDGATIALERMLEWYDVARQDNDQKALSKIQSNAAQVRALFPKDPQISLSLAALANKMNRPDEEMAALTALIDNGGEPRFARMQRAIVHASLNEHSAAVEDLRYLIMSQNSTAFEIQPGIELLQTLDPEGWRSTAERGLDNSNMDVFGKSSLLGALLNERQHASRVVELAKNAIGKANTPRDRRVLGTALALALIANGQFTEAMKGIGKSHSELAISNEIAEIFNYAVAEWGTSNVAPLDLFSRVLELKTGLPDGDDANVLQCVALCKMLLGRYTDANEDLRLAKIKALGSNTSFSCWRYLTVSAEEMARDLDEMIVLTRQEVALTPLGTGPGGTIGIAI